MASRVVGCGGAVPRWTWSDLGISPSHLQGHRWQWQSSAWTVSQNSDVPGLRFYFAFRRIRNSVVLYLRDKHAPWPAPHAAGSPFATPYISPPLPCIGVNRPTTEYTVCRASTAVPARAHTDWLGASGGKAVDLEQRKHERHAVAGAALLGIGRARHVAV